MNGMIMLDYTVQYLSSLTHNYRATWYRLFQSSRALNGRSFDCWSNCYSLVLYLMLPHRESSAALEEWARPRELHSRRWLFRISWGTKRKEHWWKPMIPQKLLWGEIVQSQDGQIKKPGKSSSKGQQKLLFTNMTLLLSWALQENLKSLPVCSRMKKYKPLWLWHPGYTVPVTNTTTMFQLTILWKRLGQ